jgi:ribose/xylose/arabinose/galactoside ABC-type transport system permease subunit
MDEDLKKILKDANNPILLLCVGYAIIMSICCPGFFTTANASNLLLNMIPILILAIGQTFVILTSGIDLSITSIIGLSSVVGAFLLRTETSLGLSPGTAILAGILAMLLVGVVIGFINGYSITRLGMPPFMVTLTTMMLFSGLAIWITKSQNIYNLVEQFLEIPYYNILGISVPLILGLLVLLLTHYVLSKTYHGQWIYAAGSNPTVAKISGVAVEKTILLTYIVSGICAGLASILYTARLETGSPVLGQTILLDVIGAVIIGGTSLFGGKGSVIWTLYGVLFITLVDNSLNLLGFPYFLIMIVKGGLILAAAIFNIMKSRSLTQLS